MPKRTKAEQARINGAKSKGPTTINGKLVSSENALKTGRFAKDAILLSTENPAVYEEFIAECVRLFLPRCRVEHRLCRELASLDWLLARYLAIDTQLINREIEFVSSADRAAGKNSTSLAITAEAYASYFDRSALPRHLAQRTSHLRRSRKETMAQLTAIRNKSETPENSADIIEPKLIDPDLLPENEPSAGPASGPAIHPEPTPQPAFDTVFGSGCDAKNPLDPKLPRAA